MPYSGPGDKSLPKNVKGKSKGVRAQWVNVFNGVYQKCVADGGEKGACETKAFRQANGVIKDRRGGNVSGLSRLFGSVVRAFTSAGLPADEVRRAVSLGMLQDMVGWALREDSAHEMAYVHDLYFEGSDMFLIMSEKGRLYRVDVKASGDGVTLGDWTEVEVNFAPTGNQQRTRVFRQADGRKRWYSVCASAVLNREGEIDSTALFDSIVRRFEESPNAFRTVYHCGEALRWGSVDMVARDGFLLLASGLFDESVLGRAVASALETAPEEWGDSIGYKPVSPPELVEVTRDVRVPVYDDGEIKEISLVLAGDACNWFTTLGAVEEVNRMEKRVKDALKKLLGDQADEFIAGVDETNRAIEANGLIARAEVSSGTPDPEAEPPAANTPAPDVPAPETPARTEIAVDAQLMGEIVRSVLAAPEMAALAELPAQIAAMREDLVGRVAALETGFTAQRSANDERLKTLERSDEDKRREWLGDTPGGSGKVTLRSAPALIRPREANGSPDEDGAEDASSEEVARTTLDKLPRYA